MIRTKPEFDSASSNAKESVLECPICEFEYLHQCGVEVFTRNAEDSDKGQHVDVDHAGSVEVTNTVSSSDGNPSGRRDGIRIKFWCEDCHNEDDPYELVISQHKGKEFVSWDLEE